MKYNYIILGSPSDLYIRSYSDLKQLKNVLYVPGIFSTLNIIERIIFRFFTWEKLTRIICLPFKTFWNKRIFKQCEDCISDHNCFVFIGDWVEYEDELQIVEYLRSVYKECKIVLFLQDLVCTKRMKNGKPWDVPVLKEKFDAVISFDHNDCDKYGFIYHHLIFSIGSVETKDSPTSDVYFVGKAKNRLNDILSAYKKLIGAGLVCDFHIAGVAIEDRLFSDEIDYEPQITYEENIHRILHTKCILEVMQKDGAGYTQRVCEAVCLDKKLITNNPEIDKAPFYNPALICKYNDAQSIDDDFIRDIKENNNVDYNYKDKFSPINFLNFIETLLLDMSNS